MGTCAALSVEEAVELALAQNTSVKITQKGEDTAAAVLKQAKGSRGFTVTAGTGVTASKTEEKSHTDTATTSLTAKLPLYTGG